jgi:WD40 repeat protein
LISYSANNHEVPLEADFSSDKLKAFSLSQRGEFVSWSLSPFECLDYIRFDAPSIRLHVFKQNTWVFCVFEHQIVCLDVKSKKLERKEKLCMNILRVVTDARVNKEESLFAIALAENQENKTEIRIFKLDETKGFISLSTVEEIESPIEIMDFTTDSTYLMFKEILGQRVFYDLLNFKKNDTLGQNFDPPFLTTGLLLSPSAANLLRLQTDDNRFTVFTLAGNKSLVATDEIGTIRIFPFPNKDGMWTKTYQDHTSRIVSLKISEDGTHAISCSSYDRSILIWEICKISTDKKLSKVYVG